MWPVLPSSEDILFEVSASQVSDVIAFCPVSLPSTVVHVPGTQASSTIPRRGTLTTGSQHRGKKKKRSAPSTRKRVQTEANMAGLCETGPKHSFTARRHLSFGFYRLGGLRSQTLQDVLGARCAGGLFSRIDITSKPWGNLPLVFFVMKIGCIRNTGSFIFFNSVY